MQHKHTNAVQTHKGNTNTQMQNKYTNATQIRNNNNTENDESRLAKEGAEKISGRKSNERLK